MFIIYIIYPSKKYSMSLSATHG